MPPEISGYMREASKRLAATVSKNILVSPSGLKFALETRRGIANANARRKALQAKGEEAPPFMVARLDGGQDALSARGWADVFQAVSARGVSILLLAGKEPLERPDVLQQAAGQKELYFPVLASAGAASQYLGFLRQSRHLVPLLRLGGRAGDVPFTEEQRVMRALAADGVLFGAVLPVAQQNLQGATSPAALNALSDSGCLVCLFVHRGHLPTTVQQQFNERLAAARAAVPRMMLLALPGDEGMLADYLLPGGGVSYVSPDGKAGTAGMEEVAGLFLA